MTYSEAVKKADAFKALNNTTVYLRDDTDFPWKLVTDVEAGGTYRFSGPVNFNLIVYDAGLTLKLSVDFETKNASGIDASCFDSNKLQTIALRLSPYMRQKLADFFRDKVLPDVAKRTREIQELLNKQWDSESCVRGIIAFAEEQSKVKSE